MPSRAQETWGGSLHQTFRILPEPSGHLRPFLTSDGLGLEEVLAKLPYDAARSSRASPTGPDSKRYRDSKQVYQTAGLLYETGGRIRVTALGHATLRWLDIINEKNAVILARHAAYALSACQLRNPTGAGEKYAVEMQVFPFSFMWRALLALDNKISSDELNRAIFKTRNEADLELAIDKIRAYRAGGQLQDLGPETETGDRKNDRIIPWVAIGSFGFILLADKRSGGSSHYEIPAKMIPVLEAAAYVRHKHREFQNVDEYVEHLARTAALPTDLR